jgi:hypothetical protein
MQIDSCNYLTLKSLCDSNSCAQSVQRSDKLVHTLWLAPNNYRQRNKIPKDLHQDWYSIYNTGGKEPDKRGLTALRPPQCVHRWVSEGPSRATPTCS